MKKVIGLLLALMMLFAFSGTSFAANDSLDQASGGDIGLDYILINHTSIDFDINGSGLADMYAAVFATSSVDRTRLSIYLQKYDGGWQTVQHYSKENSTYYCAWSNTRYVTSGYVYRLKVYYYAYEDDTSDSTVQSLYDTY